MYLNLRFCWFNVSEVRDRLPRTEKITWRTRRGYEGKLFGEPTQYNENWKTYFFERGDRGWKRGRARPSVMFKWDRQIYKTAYLTLKLVAGLDDRSFPHRNCFWRWNGLARWDLVGEHLLHATAFLFGHLVIARIEILLPLLETLL